MKTKDDIINCELVDLYIESLFFLYLSVSRCVPLSFAKLFSPRRRQLVCVFQKKLVTH